MLEQPMERRTLYGGGLGSAGVLLAGVQLVQGVQQLDGFSGSDRALVFTFETAPFVLIGLTLTVVGYWLTKQKRYEPDLPRIIAWGVGSTLLFAAVAALVLFSQQVNRNTLEGAQYVAMNLITVGAVVGILVGLYDARSRSHQRELKQERDRVETFAEKAADVNNYGRELNRSESLDEVSSLCIQGLQAFLDITEIAVVVTDRSEHEIVDNTVVGGQEDALFDLADDALDQEPTSVVTRESTPADFRGGSTLLSILVTETEDSSVVLLAVVEEAEFAEEDVQLLGMLVAHAATAIDRIYERRLQIAAEEAPNSPD